MHIAWSSPLTKGALAAALLAAACPALANAAASERVLYTFSGGGDGGNPATGIVFDGSGNAYGTTVGGGSSACGTVFELSPGGSGSYRQSVLYSFACGADGKAPHGGVTIGPDGNLYGTTVAGGTGSCSGDFCGTVFEVTARGETVLHDFTGGNDGFGPGGAVVFDSSGNMYGTTPDGGAYSAGTVYELTPGRKGWRERVIHAFTGGSDGSTGSLGPLLVDASGDLYGVTELGGAHGAGTVFRMSPRGRGGWDFRTLYAFAGSPDAAFPYGGLIAGANGALYGTTYYGGQTGAGAVFELRPQRHGWRERVLYGFSGAADGGSPTGTLAFEGSGNLLGTTSAGGNASCSCGVVFSLGVTSRRERVLHQFAGGSDGEYPYYALAPDGAGNFLASTVAGGTGGQGTIFEVTP